MDVFKTIAVQSGEILYKDRNSKFFAKAFPVNSENDIKACIETFRKKHTNAGHFCYAWQLGAEKPVHRTNDDGEPSNSAGMPIYGQLQSFGVTNILVVVARVYGGVKLGVGGLISAYRAAAQMALAESEIVEKTINRKFSISFSYKDLNKVMRIIREINAVIVSQQMEISCMITVSIRKNDVSKLLLAFEPAFEVSVQEAVDES